MAHGRARTFVLGFAVLAVAVFCLCVLAACAVGFEPGTDTPIVGVPVGGGADYASAIAEGGTTIGQVIGGPVGAGIGAVSVALAGIVGAWQRSAGRHRGYEERQLEEKPPTAPARTEGAP